MKTMKKGFTLIELLVVIAIIGILAATVLIGMRSARGKARDVQRKNNIKAVINMLELYYDDITSYPAVTAAGCHGAALTGIADLTSTLTGTGYTLSTSTITNNDDKNARYDDATTISSGAVLTSACTAATAGQGPVYVGQDMEGGNAFESQTAQ